MNRSTELDFDAFAGSMLDAVVLAGADGRISYVNAVAERMFGYAPGELAGSELTALIPARHHEGHLRGIARIRDGGAPRLIGQKLELSACRKDQSEFPIELSLSSWGAGAGLVFSGVIRDLSEQKRGERRERTQHAITRLVAESSSLMEAATRVIETICNSMEWDLGVMWMHDPRAAALHCVQFWDAQLARRSAFENQTLNTRFALGEGLPGRVWESGTAHWIVDTQAEANFPRAASASELGLHTAFAFPVIDSKDRTVGVLEFFTNELRAPDERLLAMMENIGRQIGALLERAHSIEAVQNVVEQMQVGVIVYRLEEAGDDRSLRVISVNPAVSIILDIPADAMLGGLIDENFPNLREKGFPEAFQRVVETQESMELENFVYTDPRIAPAVFTVKAFPLPDRCVGVAFENITKRSMAERLIGGERQILERFADPETSFDAILESVALFADDQVPGMLSSILLITPDGRTLDYAAAPNLPRPFVEQTGRADLGDQHMPSTLAITERDTIIITNIEDDERATGIRESALVHGFRSCWASPISTHDGDVVGVMVLYYTAGRAPENHELAVVEFGSRIVAMAVERLVSERTLRESEERFKGFMRHAPMLAFIKDLDSRYLWINEAFQERFSIPAREVPGMTDFDIFEPETAGRSVASDRMVLDSASPISRSETVKIGGGAERSFLIIKFQLTLSRGERHIGGIAIDVTERISLQKQLESSKRISSLGRLAANIAHEINNVLMGILPFAELIKRRAKEDEHLRGAAAQIIRGVDRGRRVTQEILDFTRGAEPVRQSFNVQKWLTDMTPELRAILGSEIELDMELPDEDVFVLADPMQLQQVVTNLALNARDAMEAGGRLTIHAASCGVIAAPSIAASGSTGELVRLTIADTGTGMTEEIASHIFEPLFSTKKSGNGLGLAISHQVIARHGGEISVESTPGAGTRFHLLLPCVVSPQEEQLEADQATGPSVSRVVLVEDDLSVGEGIVALLEADEVEVVWVKTGAEAAPAIARFNPEILILDVGLPDVNGFELYRQLRVLYPSLPTIFSTGHGDQSLAEQFGDAPVSHLLKPYDYDALLRTISELVRG